MTYLQEKPFLLTNIGNLTRSLESAYEVNVDVKIIFKPLDRNLPMETWIWDGERFNRTTDA